MTWTRATVVEQVRLGGGNYCLRIAAPEIAAAARPGQFVELSTGGATLLNKPISIAQADAAAGTITLVYKVVGPGTRAFSAYRAGGEVMLLGPCGNGFAPVAGRAYAVGGGIGIPPMLFLVARHAGEAAFDVLLGARTQEDLVLVQEFTEVNGRAPALITDDGSSGRRGYVTELLDEMLRKAAAPVYACGPVPMLTRVAALARAHKVPCFVCLEAYMGCGIGVCMGCVVPTVRGMERVCREGPVFDAADIAWDALGDA